MDDLPVDTGDVAEVPPTEWEDVDRPDPGDAGDDSDVEEMLAAMLADAGPVVDEKDLT
jgi:hypothetical protein